MFLDTRGEPTMLYMSLLKHPLPQLARGFSGFASETADFWEACQRAAASGSSPDVEKNRRSGVTSGSAAAKAKGVERAAEAAVKLVRLGDGCAGQRSNQTQHARKCRLRFSPGALRKSCRCGSNSHLDKNPECTSENCSLCGNTGRCCRWRAA